MSSNVRNARRLLNQEVTALNGAWKAQEMIAINQVINGQLSKLNQVANTIEDIQRDIVITEQEIRREDEAAAAAARERLEQERREKERLEKEKLGNQPMETVLHEKQR
jgi:uncharacterized membrane protein YukC